MPLVPPPQRSSETALTLAVAAVAVSLVGVVTVLALVGLVEPGAQLTATLVIAVLATLVQGLGLHRHGSP